MPIKLLHHKSWHVYGKSNVERVKRDERMDRLQVDAEQQHQRSCASDERVRLLRSRQADQTAGPCPSSLKSVGVEHSTFRAGTARSDRKLSTDAYDLNQCRSDEPTNRQGSEASIFSCQKREKARARGASEHVVLQDGAPTFKKVIRKPWYTDIPEHGPRHRGESKSEATKIALDPLKEMEAHLARKRLIRKMDALKGQQERISRSDKYETDRYNRLPQAKRTKQ